MDVLLFLFNRKEGLSVEEFRRHYLEVHAPMSVKHQIATRKYVVRLVEGGTGPVPLDAVTEIWTPSADAFFDPKTGFDTPESATEIINDAFNFLAPFPIYQVKRHVVRDDARSAGPLGARSAGTAAVRLVFAGDAANAANPAARPAGGTADDSRPPLAPADAVRTSVRYDIVRNVGTGGPENLSAVELVHLPDEAAAEALAGDAYLLGEYVHQDACDVA